jgi:DNA-binding NarL/FixJ family response regulator
MLTTREKEIVALVALGYSNKEMAARLGISHHTVARHMAQIFEKLAVHERTSVAVYAVKQRIA